MKQEEESRVDRMKREEKEEADEILHHEIGATSVSTTLGIIIHSDRLAIELVQNGKTIIVDKWQALELAKELLNNRDYLKSNQRSMFGTCNYCNTDFDMSGCACPDEDDTNLTDD